jgi:hypothetical protein
LKQQDQEIKMLKTDVKSKDMTIGQYEGKLDKETKAALEAERRAKMAEEKAQTAGAVSPEMALLPPEAKPGECSARVFVPPTYSTSTEQVLKRGPSEQVEIIPAQYQWVEEQVLVSEASSRMEEVPAQYDWEEETVLVRPAHTTWKKGRGLIEKVDNTTGEIMCLVEVPAQYRTVRKKVMVKPPANRLIEIPANYKTVRVKKMVSPPKEQRIPYAPEYETITKTKQVSEGRMEWRRVLCETNMSPTVIRKVQNALVTAGHDPGPIDGVLGRRTQGGINAYQREKGLAVGPLTYRTLESLGVKAGQ